MLFRKQISIKPHQVGYLYVKNRFRRRLEPGIYYFWDWVNEITVAYLPAQSRLCTITNQEVLTKDAIALRFSYLVEYAIVDGERFLTHFDAFSQGKNFYPYEAEQVISNLSQIYWREAIAQLDSEHLHEHRQTLLATVPETLQQCLAEYGISLLRLTLRDITFPKVIQDLFAKQLEAKIRAKADLENARTTVAAARALKNAADLIKENENIRFLQFLETMTKIAAKGNHTFVIGEWPQNGKP